LPRHTNSVSTSSTTRATVFLTVASPVGTGDGPQTLPREAKGLSQAKLAGANGFSQQLIAAIETRVTRWTKFLLRLACGARRCPGSSTPTGTSRARGRRGGAFRVSQSPQQRDQHDSRFHSSADGGAVFTSSPTAMLLLAARPPGRQCPQGLRLYTSPAKSMGRIRAGRHRRCEPPICRCPGHTIFL